MCELLQNVIDVMSTWQKMCVLRSHCGTEVQWVTGFETELRLLSVWCFVFVPAIVDFLWVIQLHPIPIKLVVG